MSRYTNAAGFWDRNSDQRKSLFAHRGKSEYAPLDKRRIVDDEDKDAPDYRIEHERYLWDLHEKRGLSKE